MGIWKRIKKLWMVFVDLLGRVQTTIMLSIVYHIAVGPLALFARVSGRDLMSKRPSPEAKMPSYAIDLAPISSTLERARRQF